MKRAPLILLLTSVIYAFLAIAASADPGNPEVDQADTTYSLSGNPEVVVTLCTGEDGVAYRTVENSYSGPSVDSSPGDPDFSLKGTQRVDLTLTYNLTTLTGIARGTVSIKRKSSLVLKGSFTAITQVTSPTTLTGNAIGWIDASFYKGGHRTTSSLYAATEFSFDLETQQIDGHIGGPLTTGAYVYAVEWNNQDC